MANPLKKAVGYARVSTRNQAEEGISLEDQAREINAFAHREGYRIVYMYEVAESAKGDTMAKRPTLRAALNLCHREGATLIVHRPDRLTRVYKLLKKLRSGAVPIEAVEIAGFAVGMEYAADILWAIYGSQAEAEKNVKSARAKVGHVKYKRRMAAEGKKPMYFGGKGGLAGDSGKGNQSAAIRYYIDVVWPVIRPWVRNGWRWGVIAAELNARAIYNRRNKPWTAEMIRTAYNRHIKRYLESEGRTHPGRKPSYVTGGGAGGLGQSNIGSHMELLIELEHSLLTYADIRGELFHNGVKTAKGLPYDTTLVSQALWRVADESGDQSMAARLRVRSSGKRLTPSDLPNPHRRYLSD